MSGPRRPAGQESAAVAVRRQKRGLLRRHWLSAALIFSCVGLTVLVGRQFLSAQQRLQAARVRRAQLEARLDDALHTKKALEAHLAKVTSDSNMELMAKSLGYAYPNERVFQAPPK